MTSTWEELFERSSAYDVTRDRLVEERERVVEEREHLAEERDCLADDRANGDR